MWREQLEAARRRAGAYLRGRDERCQLQLAARRVGADQLADCLVAEGGLAWSAAWMLPVEEEPHRTLAALRGPVVALWAVRGVVGAVAGSGEYGVWDDRGGKRLVAGVAGYRPGGMHGATTAAGRHVLIAAEDRVLRLWDALGATPVVRDTVELRIPLRALRVVVSADEDPLVVGEETTVVVDDWSMMDSTRVGGDVRVWAVAGEPPRLRELPGRRPPPTDSADRAAEVGAGLLRVSVSVSTAAALLTGGHDGVIRTWGVRRARRTPVVPVASPAAAACGVRADGQTVAVVAHHNQRIGVWDLVEGAPPETVLHGAHDAADVACVRAPGGPLLAVTAGLDGRVCVFDVDAGTLLRTIVQPFADPLPGTVGLRLPGAPPSSPGPEPVRAVAAGVLPGGRVVAVTLGDRGWVRWWCVTSGSALGAVRLERSGRAVTVGPGPTVVVTTGWDLRVFDLATAAPVATIPVVGSDVLLGVDAVDDLVVAGDGAGRLHRYGFTDRVPVGAPLDGHYRDVQALACGRHPDGRAVAVSGGFDGTVRVWDLAAGAELHRVPVEHPVYSLALAQDGAIFVGMHGVVGTLRLHATGAVSDRPSGFGERVL